MAFYGTEQGAQELTNWSCPKKSSTCDCGLLSHDEESSDLKPGSALFLLEIKVTEDAPPCTESQATIR